MKITTKGEWLSARARIFSGQLNDDDLELFYEAFSEQTIAAFKTTDFETFKPKFVQWFNQPMSFKNGMPVVTPQNTIVNNFVRFCDHKFHVTYLIDKDGKILKAY